MQDSKEKPEELKYCEFCMEPLVGVSQKEHNAHCVEHPCLNCDEENVEECLDCAYSK